MRTAFVGIGVSLTAICAFYLLSFFGAGIMQFLTEFMEAARVLAYSVPAVVLSYVALGMKSIDENRTTAKAKQTVSLFAGGIMFLLTELLTTVRAFLSSVTLGMKSIVENGDAAEAKRIVTDVYNQITPKTFTQFFEYFYACLCGLVLTVIDTNKLTIAVQSAFVSLRAMLQSLR